MRFGDGPNFGLVKESQALSSLSSATDKKRIPELLPALAHGLPCAGGQDESSAAALPKTTGREKNSWTNSRTTFWLLQGLMFGSGVAAVETTHNCINAGSCTAIPVQLQSRAAMYSIGIPAAIGVSVLSYEMKKHGNRRWFLPPALVIGADTTLAIHSGRASQ
jgi:hypothetical protein